MQTANPNLPGETGTPGGDRHGRDSDGKSIRSGGSSYDERSDISDDSDEDDDSDDQELANRYQHSLRQK